jgi:hypothetical protein
VRAAVARAVQRVVDAGERSGRVAEGRECEGFRQRVLDAGERSGREGEGRSGREGEGREGVGGGIGVTKGVLWGGVVVTEEDVRVALEEVEAGRASGGGWGRAARWLRLLGGGGLRAFVRELITGGA